MRIAICLSGLVRTYRQTYPNFIQQLIEPNRLHDVDVFISTWPIEHSNNSMERTRRIAWSNGEAPPFPEDAIDYSDLESKYNPISMIVEQPLQFAAPWYTPTPGTNIQSIMSMMYKIYSCDLLRRQRELATGLMYDAVLRARFDVAFPFPIPITEQTNLEVVTTPSMAQERFHPDFDWTNDKFAMGNSAVMTAYSNWFLCVPSLSKQCLTQPEILLCQHLKNHGVHISEWGEELALVRAF